MNNDFKNTMERISKEISARYKPIELTQEMKDLVNKFEQLSIDMEEGLSKLDYSSDRYRFKTKDELLNS